MAAAPDMLSFKIYYKNLNDELLYTSPVITYESIAYLLELENFIIYNNYKYFNWFFDKELTKKAELNSIIGSSYLIPSEDASYYLNLYAKDSINLLAFLNSEGVSYLWKKLSLQDYPNNETLISVLDAIDETKADKSEVIYGEILDTVILSEHTITINGTLAGETGIYMTNESSVITFGSSYNNIIQPGLSIYSASLLMNNVDVTDLYMTFDNINLIINIPSVTGDIEIYYEAD